MIKVGIIGGAGYTAGELLRILVNHPEAEVVYVHSNSNADMPIYSVHKDLVGDLELNFTDKLHFDLDVLFICAGHGQSRTFMEKNKVPATVKIIDLSIDYRLKDSADGFVYGLPELNLEAIKSSNKIANPGCFATAIQLGLLPLADNGALSGNVHVNAITGSTGAGQQPTSTSHYSWRNNNISIYKAFNHQHLGEIGESLHQLQPEYRGKIQFIPVRGNFTKGIFATLYLDLPNRIEEVKGWYQDFYKEAPFVHVLENSPDMKQVINTNKCLLYLEKHADTILITSCIDNLIKGASGQAIQNMNLMFGLDQTMGLKMKSLGF